MPGKSVRNNQSNVIYQVSLSEITNQTLYMPGKSVRNNQSNVICQVSLSEITNQTLYAR